MEDKTVERRLVVNSLLCFVVTKMKRFDWKRIKKAVLDTYSAEAIACAKLKLLKDSSNLNLDRQLSRFPGRQGVNKTETEVNDIIELFKELDERKSISVLPRYVTDNCDSFPVLPLEEGDMKYLVAKLDKMEAIIVGLQTVVHNLATCRLAPDPPVVNPLGAGKNPVVTVPNFLLSAGQSETQSATSAQSKPALENPSEKPRRVQPAAKRGQKKSWDTLIDAEYSTSSAGSNYGDDDDGFQVYESPRHKRRRMRSEKQLMPSVIADAGNNIKESDHENRPQKNPSSLSYSAAVMSTDVRSVNKRRNKNSRQPLLIGTQRSITTDNGTPMITAEKPFKAVYYVGNVCSKFDDEALVNFTGQLGVRVYSCHQVHPRMSQWQRSHKMTPSQHAFRICINRADNRRFLDPTKWPSDIMISRWFRKKQDTSVGDDVGDDELSVSAERSGAPDRITADSAASASASSLWRALSEIVDDNGRIVRTSSPEEHIGNTTGNTTVIEVDLGDTTITDDLSVATNSIADGSG